MAQRVNSDATGKTADERFVEIRACFLELLSAAGHSRGDLYSRPKLGDSREPTEAEIVHRWAERYEVSVNDICIGIQRAFAQGALVTSFRYCVPQIIQRVRELRESRAGLGPVTSPAGIKPEALERIRKRMKEQP